jgi:hypothetical protein
MESWKQDKVVEYIADSIETGYSSVFTFAVKEILNAKERTELANFLRSLTSSQPNELSRDHRISPPIS